MGAGACQQIIIEGNIGYGIVEKFGEDNPRVNVINLEAAIEASCQGILHASLYFVIEDEYKLTDKYTKPIIDLHKQLTLLCDLKGTNAQKQQFVDKLTAGLEAATRKTLELFD